ncbi:type II secretion system protein GspK [Alteromonas facilis]|uniref:type II secretion system protein GspK n=1 Tax=Alteromonas facilis TaxID=2048004 RepID=UPI000C294B56|nr:type II secretion system protein GspK [Alteromonas facilis]
MKAQIRGVNTGIALVQVLLLISILSVLLLYLTDMARKQVAVAQISQYRVQSQIELFNAESIIAFELLTREKFVNELNTGSNFIDWNFYGQRFSLLNTSEIELQDQAGLLSLNYVDCEKLVPALRQYGIPHARSNFICRLLIDAQDPDDVVTSSTTLESNSYSVRLPNTMFTHKQQLQELNLFSQEEIVALTNLLTVHSTGWLNPYLSDEKLIASLSSNEEADMVAAARQIGFVSLVDFQSIVNIAPDESVWFNFSNNIDVTISSTVGEITMVKKSIWNVNPYASGASGPINELNISKL